MPELRWALLVLGALVVVGIYLYSRRGARQADDSGEVRAEPVIRGEDIWGDEDEGGPGLEKLGRNATREASDSPEAATGPGIEATRARSHEPVITGFEREDQPAAEEAVPDIERAPEPEPESIPEGPPPDPDRIVAMRVSAPQGRSFPAETLVVKLRELGLRHGKYSIFHKYLGEGEGRPVFSVASMVEPGSFDLTKLRESALPGVSIFMVLPGPGDPVETFDTMVESARELARDLDGELLDETGSSWSIQRERYLREELIRYRLHHGRG